MVTLVADPSTCLILGKPPVEQGPVYEVVL